MLLRAGDASPPQENLVRLREDRHHPRRAARDHAAGVRGELLVEGDAADGDAELAHRLLRLGLLAPRRLDEAARLGVIPGEELAELIERRDVVPGALAQPPRGVLE